MKYELTLTFLASRSMTQTIFLVLTPPPHVRLQAPQSSTSHLMDKGEVLSFRLSTKFPV